MTRIVIASLLLLTGCKGTLDIITDAGSNSVDAGSGPPAVPDAGIVDAGSRPPAVPDAGIVDAGADDAGPVEPPPPPPAADLHFNLVIRQTEQACSSCGIWFDPQGDPSLRPRLVVRYRAGGEERTLELQRGLEHPLYAYFIDGGSRSRDERQDTLLVKGTPRRNGLVFADLSSIPADANILEARLHLHIHTHEGLANSDRSSVLTVYQGLRRWDFATVDWNQYAAGMSWTTAGGDAGDVVREIRADRDLWGRGFSKGSPHAHFDFTDYVAGLQAAR